MAVVCGSLPALRPYVDPLIPRISVTWPRSKGSRDSSKRTGYSTGNSDAIYSPSTHAADYRKFSYPMTPISPNGTIGQWKHSHPVRQQNPTTADLEAGMRPVLEERDSSESETRLIIQGNRTSNTYDPKVSAYNQDESTGGQAVEQSDSANAISVPIEAQVRDRQHRRKVSIVSISSRPGSIASASRTVHATSIGPEVS